MHELAREAFSEAVTYRDKTYEPSQVERMVMTDYSVCSFVSEEDGRINGMVIGQLQRGLFFTENIVTNLLLYVAPGKRGTNLPLRLVRRLEQFAREAGADQVHLNTSGGYNPPRLLRFFKAMGYTEAGVSTIKEL